MLDESAFIGTSLCVVGNINRDIRPAPLRADVELFQDGETSVATVIETMGGGGGNSALAAAGLGASVSLAGKVGTDGLGKRLERALREQGITPHLAHDAAHPTGTSIALAFDNGRRHFISCLPASESLAFDDLDLSALSGRRHLLRADIWFSEAMLQGGNERLFRAARAEGMEVSMDLNWDPWWGRAPEDKIRARKEAARAALPWVDCVHGNAQELMAFAEAGDLNTALYRLAKWGAGAVVVHLGSEGAGYYAEGVLTREPAAPAAHRVHTTGTGDVLSVCLMLLSQRSEGTISERLRLSNRIVAEYIEGKRSFVPLLAD